MDARFENFRAEGAFLVSAAWSEGRVQSLDILSERGAPCHLYSAWSEGMKVIDGAGQAVKCSTDDFGRVGFTTQSGGRYRVRPATDR